MGLIQIEKRTGDIREVPQGTTPILELDLDPHQRVISVELFPVPAAPSDTVNWLWSAYIESDMRPVATDEPDPLLELFERSRERDRPLTSASPSVVADSQRSERFPGR